MRPLTKEEGIEILDRWVENEISKYRSWWERRRRIVVHLTRILEPYEKSANHPLPERIEQNSFTIDKTGIQTLLSKIDWSEVCVCGIAVEDLGFDQFENKRLDYFLLIVLHSKEVKRFTLHDFDKYKGLLGHFIELYRLQER